MEEVALQRYVLAAEAVVEVQYHFDIFGHELGETRHREEAELDSRFHTMTAPSSVAAAVVAAWLAVMGAELVLEK